MAITYTWNVTNLFTIDANPSEPNYVVTAFYNLNGVDGLYAAQLNLSAFFDVKETDPNFTPYEDLTEEIVIGWIQAQLGADQIANYEESIAGQINSQINPPVTPMNTPLPWETN
jgi:hypothetical protein